MLFITLPVLGQDKDFIIVTNVNPIGLSNMDYSKEYFVISFVKLYDEYKQECEADSTEIEVGGYWDVVKTEKVNDYGVYSGYDVFVPRHKVWKHREPTFDGFMEFLKGKTK